MVRRLFFSLIVLGMTARHCRPTTLGTLLPVTFKFLIAPFREPIPQDAVRPSRRHPLGHCSRVQQHFPRQRQLGTPSTWPQHGHTAWLFQAVARACHGAPRNVDQGRSLLWYDVLARSHRPCYLLRVPHAVRRHLRGP